MSQYPDGRPTHGTDRLALLYRVSQTFNSSLDLKHVLDSVMDEVIAATHAERGFLMLRNDGGALTFRAARGLDQSTIHRPEFQVSRSIVDRVAQEGKALLTSNAQSDDWLSARQSVVFLGLRSVLCVPLQVKGRMLGVIYVDNRVQAGIFSAADLDLLASIAASAAVAIENARLYQVAVEKGRMERELQMARELQASLLPRVLPAVPGWQFAARWVPAQEVAGDFYDMLLMEDGQVSLTIADVAGKGMAAALFMALTRSVVRASARADAAPAEGLRRANRLVCADAADGMFVTLFYGRLDPALGELTYVNAGHNPPLLYSHGQRSLQRLTRTALVLGVEENAEIEQRTARLAPGDVLLLYTDGITEALDADGQEFGEERLAALLVEHGDASAAGIVETLERSLHTFTAGVKPFDDLTAMVVKKV